MIGDLHVRYRKSVPIDDTLEIRAQIKLVKPPLFKLRAEISSKDCLLAWAEGKFMQRS